MNDTSNIGIIPCASKSGSVNMADQFLHILFHKYRMSRLKRYN